MIQFLCLTDKYFYEICDADPALYEAEKRGSLDSTYPRYTAGSRASLTDVDVGPAHPTRIQRAMPPGTKHPQSCSDRVVLVDAAGHHHSVAAYFPYGPAAAARVVARPHAPRRASWVLLLPKRACHAALKHSRMCWLQAVGWFCARLLQTTTPNTIIIFR